MESLSNDDMIHSRGLGDYPLVAMVAPGRQGDIIGDHV